MWCICFDCILYNYDFIVVFLFVFNYKKVMSLENGIINLYF